MAASENPRKTSDSCGLLLLVLGGALLVTGCNPDDSVAETEAHACSAAWGELPEATVFVSPIGQDGASGSLDDPLPGLDQALALTRTGAAEAIALLPGQYAPSVLEPTLSLSGLPMAEGLGTDSGLILAGCGPEETQIIGRLYNAGDLIHVVEAEPPMTATNPSALVLTNDLHSVSIRSLGLQGGWIGLSIRGGVGTEGEVVLSNVRITEAIYTAIHVNSTQGSVLLRDVVMEEFIGDAPTFGDGLGHTLGMGLAAYSVQQPWTQTEMTIRMDGGRIQGALGLGMGVVAATVELVNLQVLDTQTTNGVLGRGIHLAETSAVLDGVEIRGSHDAGIFLHDTSEVSITNSTIAATSWSTNPDAPEQPTADGLVIYGNPEFGPEASHISLTNTRFESNSRVGVLADGVTLQVGGGNVFENNLLPKDDSFPLLPDDDTVFFQGDALLEGVDGSPPGLEGVPLGPDEDFPALSFHDFSLSGATDVLGLLEDLAQ